MFTRSLLLLLVLLPLTGCLGVRLKQLEIRQLQTEAAAISDENAYLNTHPALGQDYEGRAFVAADAFNAFLTGLDNYDVALSRPNGAVLRFEQTRLQFEDGLPHAIIQAKAVDKSGQIEVKVRVRADLYVEANHDKDQLQIRFQVREILPDIKLSIFRWRQFWLGMAILTLEANKYVESMPLTVIPLRADLPINVDPPGTNRIDVNNGKGWIDVKQTLPHFQMAYSYRVIRALTLQDGIHVFFTLEQEK
jgi:hypothetical protein